MAFLANPWALVACVALISMLSILVTRRRATVDGFFGGADKSEVQPSLWTLVLSQVTTWIFARSLMNAAILGYFYGFAGTLAYTAYYLSFLTGMLIIANLRQKGARSVQDWLGSEFGRTGHITYNIVVGLRLLSEVFANLIVVGLIFSAAFPEIANAKTIAIVAIALVGLAYSAQGGLRASLRTDVMQMTLFLCVFAIALTALVTSDSFSFSAILTAQGAHDMGAKPGWILLAVAFLQVFSYPAHDPVMMDRGFIADEATTRRSFIHAFWISAICIFGFGMFGIQAGLLGATYENQLLGTWQTMFGPTIYFLIAASLLVSALSTLDSALASSARLVVEEFGLGKRSVVNGRISMIAFMAAGAVLTLWGNKTLFDAVAVSGTASMFLAPILIIGLFKGQSIPLGSYLIAYCSALIGAAAYMYRDTALIAGTINTSHKYELLLYICIGVLVVGFAAVGIGAAARSRVAQTE